MEKVDGAVLLLAMVPVLWLALAEIRYWREQCEEYQALYRILCGKVFDETSGRDESRKE